MKSWESLLEGIPHTSWQEGFQVLLCRRVVERTLGWFNRYRRPRKDSERLVESSEGMVYIASLQTILKRLALHS